MIGIFDKLKIEIYGESHAPFIGGRLWGLPAGLKIDFARILRFLSRRGASDGVWSTPRREADEAEIVSGVTGGVHSGVSNGDTLEIRIKNGNVKSSDYEMLSLKPRPSHADYAMFLRDGRIAPGGGRFSGRMTAPLCALGGIASGILAERGIEIFGYVGEIGGISGGSYRDADIKDGALENARNAKLPLLKPEREEEIVNAIKRAAADGDSLGGAVECVVLSLPAGKLGDALFEGLESKISYAVFAVPAVKGVEFGGGFLLSSMRGSEANDAFYSDDGKTLTRTNFSGGINGGITNGMPLTLRAAIRPTPSISKPQETVDLRTGENAIVEITGRHDACIVPRAVPCVESAVALALLDEVLKRGLI